MKRYFMGIDIGTYESKGVIIDDNCNVVVATFQPHDIEHPMQNFFEHDAERTWWHDFTSISKKLLKDGGIENNWICAVGISTLGPDLLPVDENLTPLRKAILYGIDSRASSEIEQLTNEWGTEKVNELVGHPFNSNDIAPKILWIKNNEPEVYAKTAKFLTGSSYITAKLTGNYVVDRYLAMGTCLPLYQADGSIDEENCQTFCRAEQLAKVLDTTDIAGKITKHAAYETGLAEGTPVLTGTDDTAAEAISVGILKQGDLMVMFGSSLYMIGLTEKNVNDNRIWSDPFIIPNSFSVQGGTNAAGTLTRWYRDHIFTDLLKQEKETGKNAYEAMYEECSNIPAGSDGLITLPYIAGERTPIDDPNARGLLFGMNIKHTRAYMYHSALESIAYSVAQHIEIFKDNGLSFSFIRAIGGGSKNPIWMQIVANVTGMEVHTAAITVGAAYGDAIMAAIANGCFTNFAEVSEYIKSGKIYYPNPDHYVKYQNYLDIYKKLYIATKTYMHAIPF